MSGKQSRRDGGRMISLTSVMALHPSMNGATTSQTLETSSFRGHHEACHAVLGMTPERTMTPVVTMGLVLDGTAAIKERKPYRTLMLKVNCQSAASGQAI